ncbi:MAG: TerC/Alx family metal homeostasis membrane protein [Cardiobacteriaceae bacterium]|nr:TerC/Alx family metal homeostasis membrane protein [Cardiobacteriaceae bacterium]
MTINIGFPPETVIIFIVLAMGAITIDLYAHRKDKPLSLKSAALWTLFWVAIAIIFGIYLWLHHGATAAQLFFTGYALEEVLSVDNLFVMMAIFTWFKIPENYRHRVLYWGVIGAVVFRMIFVAIGTSLMALGPFVEVIFALIVAWTAVMMLKSNDDQQSIEDYSEHMAYRIVHRFFPVWPHLHGHNFFLNGQELEAARHSYPEAHLELAGEDPRHPERSQPHPLKKGALVATPLFLCLAVIELTDVMFAFDSVPAILGISKDPLIVYSAMMFAILGLRTLYFVLEAMKDALVHLEKAVIVLLFFIAGKLGLSASDHFFHHGYDISPKVSLIIVLIVLCLGIGSSLFFPAKQLPSKH